MEGSRVQSFEACLQQLDQAAFATDQGFRSPSGRPGRTSRSRGKSSANTGPAPEEIARALTWDADEKELLVLAAAGCSPRAVAASDRRIAGNCKRAERTCVSLVYSALQHFPGSSGFRARTSRVQSMTSAKPVRRLRSSIPVNRRNAKAHPYAVASAVAIGHTGRNGLDQS